MEAEAPPLNTLFELHFKRRIPAVRGMIHSVIVHLSIVSIVQKIYYIIVGSYRYWKRPPDVILYVREGLEQESSSVKVGGVHEYEWQFCIV